MRFSPKTVGVAAAIVPAGLAQLTLGMLFGLRRQAKPAFSIAPDLIAGCVDPTRAKA